MSSEMREWCRVEMRKINNSDDLTLLEFCYSLESGEEIKEYLTMYLGSAPAVQRLASEFITRKNF